MDLSDFAKEHPSLPSDSEESDDDYAPSGPGSSSEDGNDLQGADSGSSESEDQPTSGKRSRTTPPFTAAKRSKKCAVFRGGARRVCGANRPQTQQQEDQEAGSSSHMTEEEEKNKADTLWQDFKREGSEMHRNAGMTNGAQQPPGPSTVTVTQVYQFAGEEVSVQKEVAADSAHARLAGGRGRGRSSLKGLSSVLGQLGRKPKIGTLEKSKLDWDRFKQQEGIHEDIRTFNRGKDGFLERQDFLQRTDVRQFEIERALRTTRRSNR